MSIPTLEQLMSASISELAEWELLATGPYFGVITNVEARDGAKAAYLNVEVTLHQTKDGDETMKGRRVWRNVSFSEKAINMPGGLAQLVQSTKPEGLDGIAPEQLPAALAQAVTSSPVGIDLGHEQGWKDGGPQVDEKGNPVMREAVDGFFAPDDSFGAGIEAESNGNDADLPF